MVWGIQASLRDAALVRVAPWAEAHGYLHAVAPRPRRGRTAGARAGRGEGNDAQSQVVVFRFRDDQCDSRTLLNFAGTIGNSKFDEMLASW